MKSPHRKCLGDIAFTEFGGWGGWIVGGGGMPTCRGNHMLIGKNQTLLQHRQEESGGVITCSSERIKPCCYIDEERIDVCRVIENNQTLLGYRKELYYKEHDRHFLY